MHVMQSWFLRYMDGYSSHSPWLNHGCKIECLHILIHVIKWHQFPPVRDTHQYAWCFKGLWLILARACWHTPHTQAWNLVSTIVHQMWNFAGFSPWKWGIPLTVFSRRRLGENSVLCAMTHLRRSTARFFPWKAKCSWIFIVEIQQWSQMH